MAPPPTSLPISSAPRLLDDLAHTNAARHDWFAEGGQQERDVHGRYQRIADFRISTTDPDATPMQLKGGGVHLGYHTHYVVDGGPRRIILAVLVTPGEVMDNQPMLDLRWHVAFRWHLRPRHVTGDTAYGTLEHLHAIEQADIRAYIPVKDGEEKVAVWSTKHFIYETEADQYRCPQDQILKRVGEVDRSSDRQMYRAPRDICNACPVYE